MPDVNVWLALVSRRHVHNSRAVGWWKQIEDQEVAFCRVTQMGLLRLLTNTRVMGADVITQAQAWSAYERIRLDPRVLFAAEPAGLEAVWKKHAHATEPATNLWTDAYLLAFAECRDMLLVTLDKAFCC